MSTLRASGLRGGFYRVPDDPVATDVLIPGAVERLRTDALRLAAFRDEPEAEIFSRIPDARINGARDHRVPHATSITFPGVNADGLIARLPDPDVSAASACHAGIPDPSQVLRAIGLTTEDAYSTLCLSSCTHAGFPPVPAIASRLTEAIRTLAAAARHRATRPAVSQPT